MKKRSSLHINIPNPCNQDWSIMQKAGDGKYCTQCSNVVYDFSGMSDDGLLNFFKDNPNTHCGRFHNSQLNRNILPSVTKQKLFLNRFNKIAAAFFAVLSFRHSGLHAEAKSLKPDLALDAVYRNRVSKNADKIIITGFIKDDAGKPLQGAVVQFDSIQVSKTDNQGKFSFELQSVTAASHNLYFSYDSLITVVRSYYPAMQSTDYDIVLYKQGTGGSFTMGIPLPPFDINVIGELPSLVFAAGSAKLSMDSKAMLAHIAMKLKEAPNASINIVAFDNGTKKGKLLLTERTKNIIEYLIEKEGISADRLFPVVDKNIGKETNTVDFLNHDPK